MSLELADIFRNHEVPCWTSEQARAVADIRDCRTEAMGGYRERCDQCGHSEVRFCSCGNRHCPKCQNLARAAWVERRRAELLPVPYFHVVFTLPHELARLALYNPRILYNILFRASAAALLDIAADPKHLGARVGVLTVLHTWGQTLTHHPHVHCLVPAGGLSLDGERWVSTRKGFFLPVRVLSERFKTLYLRELNEVRDDLKLLGALSSLAQKAKFITFLDRLRRKKWVVYAQPPFSETEDILNYQARYANRTALTNQRFVACDDRRITFTWKDYRQNRKQRLMSLDVADFIRRFLVHILPQGLPRVRYYGQLANRNKRTFIEKSLTLLNVPKPDQRTTLPTSSADWFRLFFSRPVDECRACRDGRMIVAQELPGRRTRGRWWASSALPRARDWQGAQGRGPPTRCRQ